MLVLYSMVLMRRINRGLVDAVCIFSTPFGLERLRVRVRGCGWQISPKARQVWPSEVWSGRCSTISCRSSWGRLRRLVGFLYLNFKTYRIRELALAEGKDEYVEVSAGIILRFGAKGIVFANRRFESEKRKISVFIQVGVAGFDQSLAGC